MHILLSCTISETYRNEEQSHTFTDMSDTTYIFGTGSIMQLGNNMQLDYCSLLLGREVRHEQREVWIPNLMRAPPKEIIDWIFFFFF